MTAVSGLDITTLGALSVSIDGRPVDIRLNKAMALLVYLAETGRPQHRATLAGLLWPDRPDAAARNNLRQTLTALRKLVGEHLVVMGERVQLNAEVRIDTRPFDLDGYAGPFLDGFSVTDSDLFDEWAARVRANHEASALASLRAHAEAGLAGGDIVGARSMARRVLEIEPWTCSCTPPRSSVAPCAPRCAVGRSR